MPAMTPPPDVAAAQLAARDASVYTTFTLSDCEYFADPDGAAGDGSGCMCSGYTGTLPDTPDCNDYSTLVTLVDISAYPFTSTLANNALVGYASSEDWEGGTIGVGSSSTLQAGTSITLQMAPTSSVNIGVMSDAAAQSSFYSAVSSQIISACPGPVSGSTVTTCTATATIDNVLTVQSDQASTHGGLELTFPLISVSDPNIYSMLVTSIASGLLGNAQSTANNTGIAEYDCINGFCGPVFNRVNLTNVPAYYQSFVAVQDSSTNGAVVISNLEVGLVIEGGAKNFACTDGAFVFSLLSTLGGAIDGFGYLTAGTLGSFAGLGLTIECDASNGVF